VWASPATQFGHCEPRLHSILEAPAASSPIVASLRMLELSALPRPPRFSAEPGFEVGNTNTQSRKLICGHVFDLEARTCREAGLDLDFSWGEES